MSGHQYPAELTPATAQCSDVDERTVRNTEAILSRSWITFTEPQLQTLTRVTQDFTAQLCPPWFRSQALTDLASYISERYRSLSRPNPYLWNIILFGAIVLIPWMRRYWYPYLLALGLWTYHASISAVVLNVQPRYVVVTNPMKAVIIVLMLFFVLQLIVRLFDVWLASLEQRKDI